MKVWRGRCRDRIRKCLIALDGIANSGTWCVVLLASALEVSQAGTMPMPRFSTRHRSPLALPVALCGCACVAWADLMTLPHRRNRKAAARAKSQRGVLS
jgi:hypothetical protein